MIETENQRRWWFATHPEYSSGRSGHRSRKQHDRDEDSDKPTPESVDAYVNESLKYQSDEVIITLLEQLKFWFGTEFASKSPREQHALLYDDEDDNGTESWLSQHYSGHPAASRDRYDQYEDVLDRIDTHQQEIWEVAIERDKMGLEPDPHTVLDVLP